MKNSRLDQIQKHLPSTSAKTQASQEANLANLRSLLERGHIDAAERLTLSIFLSPPRHEGNAQAREILSTSTQSTIEVDGETIAVVLLSHGFGFSAAAFAFLISKLLVETSFRIVAFDHAAHGSSSGSTASFETFIRTTQKLISDPVNHPLESIVAHSVGASAAIMALAEMAGPFNDLKLVAINPPMQPVTVMQMFCKSHGLPTTLIPGMDKAFSPSPSDILKFGYGGRLSGMKILLINDEKDRIAPIGDTKRLADTISEKCELKFETTKGLNHLKILQDDNVLNMVMKGLKV